MVLQEEQVRLVSVLETGLNDADLHVSRRHVYTLPSESVNAADSSTSSYIAISYVWGQGRHRIKCDDKTLEVSSHLMPALHQLHRHFPDKLYWTDSISIDQQSPAEKAHQVSMMGRIFATAESVAVWFGEDPDDIHGRLLDPHLELRDNETAKQARISLMKQLSENPWFYRAWTFQEIRLARRAVVMLGANLMPWADFVQRIQTLRTFEPHLSTVTIRSQARSYSKFTYAPKDQFFSVLDELNSGNTQDLAGLLFATWYREASVKHDKIYSLLSSALFDGYRDHEIEIDYDVAWSVLCIRAARACINTASDLKILRIAGMKQRWKSGVTNRWDGEEFNHLLNHPAWAPNWWEPPQQMRSSASLIYDRRGVFCPLAFCCPETPPVQSTGDTSPFLVLKGVLLGIINTGDPPSYNGGPTLVHAPPHCATRLPQSWIKRPAPIEPTLSLQGVCRVSMPSFIEDVQNHLHGKCTCVPFHERHDNQFGFNKSLLSHNPVSWEAVKMRFDSSYHFSLDLKSVGAKGDDGVVDESTVPAQVLATSVESGDWLVLLEGGGTPFVLRPVMDRMGNAQRPEFLMSPAERKNSKVPDDAGCFVLVGEASMCWDELWPGMWDMYCRAGEFVIV